LAGFRVPRSANGALVALGAALFELLEVQLADQHGADPTRIAAHVVSGVDSRRVSRQGLAAGQ
jgi:hypothetical protein